MPPDRPLQLPSEWDERLRRMLAVSALGHVLLFVLVIVLAERMPARPLPMVAYTVEITDRSALGGRLPPGAPGADLKGGPAHPPTPVPKGEPAAPKAPEPEAKAAEPPAPPPEAKPADEPKSAPKPEPKPEEPAKVAEAPKPPEPPPVAKAPEPPKPEPKPEAKAPEPPKPEPKPEAKKPEPPKLEPAKPEPAKPEPKTAEPPKPDAGKATAKAAEPKPEAKAAAKPEPAKPAATPKAGTPAGHDQAPARDAYAELAEKWKARAAGGGLGGSDTGSGPIGTGGEGKGGGELVGVDFLAYRQQVINTVKAQWTNVIVRPGLVAAVKFAIAPDGGVSGVALARSSGNPAYDASAVRAVQHVGQLPPPPARYVHEFGEFVIEFHSEEHGGEGAG